MAGEMAVRRNIKINEKMDAKKLIGIHIDTNALSLSVKTDEDAKRVEQTLNDSQMRHCRRLKGTNTFTLYSGGWKEETLAEYLNEKK